MGWYTKVTNQFSHMITSFDDFECNEILSEREIEQFIEQVNVLTKIDEDWRKFLHQRKEADISAIIEE